MKRTTRDFHRIVRHKYRGNALNDIASYLECREHIREGFMVAHFTKLKSYYRRAFLNAPFRKGF